MTRCMHVRVQIVLVVAFRWAACHDRYLHIFCALSSITWGCEAQGLVVAREVDEVLWQRLAATLYLQR